jgi:hypothetical protein
VTTTREFMEARLRLLREEAAEFERNGAEGAAKARTAVAEDLEREWHAHQQEPMKLAAAALESGYSVAALQLMLKQGKIPNAGERGTPRILRCNLPRKPGHDVVVPRPTRVESRQAVPSIAERAMGRAG